MIKYTKKKLAKLLKRLHYLIRNHNGRIEYKKLSGGIAGYYYRETDEIEIDYRRDIVATLIHEALHKYYPDWSETKVERHESRIVNLLTPRQFKSLIRAMAKYVT